MMSEELSLHGVTKGYSSKAYGIDYLEKNGLVEQDGVFSSMYSDEERVEVARKNGSDMSEEQWQKLEAVADYLYKHGPCRVGEALKAGGLNRSAFITLTIFWPIYEEEGETHNQNVIGILEDDDILETYANMRYRERYTTGIKEAERKNLKTKRQLWG